MALSNEIHLYIFSDLLEGPSPPKSGEKVAYRPDEGVSVGWQSIEEKSPFLNSYD